MSTNRILTELRRRFDGSERETTDGASETDGADRSAGPSPRLYTDGGVQQVPQGHSSGSLAGRLVEALFGESDADQSPPTVSPTELDEELVLDDRGSFSEEAFVEATGYTTGEFVVEYVERNGGGVRQIELVECLPWSASKVSRLLGSLERNGRVVRRSVGRENAVFLPHTVPDVAE